MTPNTAAFQNTAAFSPVPRSAVLRGLTVVIMHHIYAHTKLLIFWYFSDIPWTNTYHLQKHYTNAHHTQHKLSKYRERWLRRETTMTCKLVASWKKIVLKSTAHELDHTNILLIQLLAKMQPYWVMYSIYQFSQFRLLTDNRKFL